jgi:mono/diheme cytochrome c family protein
MSVAQSQLLGLFHDAGPTADAIEQLRELGVPDEKITVMSGVPYRADMLGRPRPKGKVGWIAVTGTGVGLATALILTLSSYLLYPIQQGGQPLIPVPPTLIILFEFTMLGTMWAAFIGLLLQNRFPKLQSQLYDPRITEGHIGVAAEVDSALAARVEQILTANGAHHLKRVDATAQPNRSFGIFWATVLGALGVGGIAYVLLAYSFIYIPIPTNMAEQDSIAPQMGPRLAAPPDSVPIQGPVLIDDQPATAPISATANSLQRGKVLFNMHCALCHGPNAVGDGPLSKYFTPKPADLTSDKIQKLRDGEIFVIITQGVGKMPRLSENLDPGERWDVINYVRTFKHK